MPAGVIVSETALLEFSLLGTRCARALCFAFDSCHLLRALVVCLLCAFARLSDPFSGAVAREQYDASPESQYCVVQYSVF